MFLRFCHQLSLLSALVGASTFSAECVVCAAESSVAQGRLAPVWVQPGSNGSQVSAVLVQADSTLAGVQPQCSVILVDTSASQIGEHRQLGLAVLEQLLKQWPAGVPARLMAVDVQTTPLHSSFETAQSPAMQSAVDLLNQRIPLGATDLPSALRGALDAIPVGQAASVIYIGDGVNAAAATTADEWRSLLGLCRDRQVSVSAYGVGPQVNLHLLGVMAHQTGGIVAYDTLRPTALAAASTLTSAVTGAVVYPSAWGVESSALGMLPTAPLPLRHDRETVYVIPSSIPADAQLSMVIDGAESAWKTAAAEDRGGMSFLPAFQSRLQREGDLANSLAGRQLMLAAQDDFNAGVAQLVTRGQAALSTGQQGAAQDVARLVNQLDPRNSSGRALALAVRPVRLAQFGSGNEEESVTVDTPEADTSEGVEGSTTDAPTPDESLAGESAEMNGDETDTSGDAMPAEGMSDETMSDETMSDGVGAGDEVDALLNRTRPESERSLIGQREQLIAVQTQMLVQRVGDDIQDARQGSPDQGIDLLKRLLTVIRSAPDIAPEARERMQKQLTSEILSLQVKKDDLDRRSIREQERLAQLEARERLADAFSVQEDRLATLIDRVRALMEEGRAGDEASLAEAEAVARVAVSLRPGERTATAALFGAEAALQLARTFRQRSRRADQFLETLYQVEESHVPFPDEPPIRFPPAEVWKALTERRRATATLDLRRNRPSEDRIAAELGKPTEIDFTDTPLRDCLTFLEDQHDIDIVLDEASITEDGGSTDTPINLSLSGITLRSALRLMLEREGLTYIIQDEVMKITTTAKAESEESQQVKVYRVGDLVVPIVSQQAGGLGGLGGQGGQLGGGGGPGGGGGGFGGQGGGGFGGGQGGGGGFFSIPPQQPSPVTKKKAAR